MIISRSYFTGSIDIPQAINVANSSILTGTGKKLDWFIEEYERDVMIKSLGVSLYNELQSHLEIKSGQTTQTIKDSAPQHWKDLFDGKPDYLVDGSQVTWRGLKYQVGTEYRSFIAYYVYYHYLSETLSSLSQTGLKVEQVKNAIDDDPTVSLVRAWNTFHEIAVESRVNGDRSLYQFIEDMNNQASNTFANWMPKEFKRINRFSI